MHGADPDPKPVTPDEPEPAPADKPPPPASPVGNVDSFNLEDESLG